MRAWVAHPDSRVWIGGLVILDHQHLVLRVDSANPKIRLPLQQIERLEVSRGYNPLLTVGGPITGAVVGALLAPVLTEEAPKCAADAVDDPDCTSETPEPLIGAAVGAILVGLLANLVAEERWTELPLGEFTSVTVSARTLRFRIWLAR